MSVEINTVTLHKIGATTKGPRACWRSRKLLVLLQYVFLPGGRQELLHLFELLRADFTAVSRRTAAGRTAHQGIAAPPSPAHLCLSLERGGR